MKTTQEIIAKLPAECWGVLPSNQTIIKIKAGEMGYYPLKYDLNDNGGFTKVGIFQITSDKPQTADALADWMNEENGITKAQRKAMEWGSQFGWDHGLANPEAYDVSGRPYSKKNPRPTI